ncbi:MAG: hypothetical protein AMJ46_00150 [Latescibacteria bacterium DG_63]|nr:MAG: hypothetical protein AMJ46_00150 [Latescibacteria bacterium DG_63]
MIAFATRIFPFILLVFSIAGAAPSTVGATAGASGGTDVLRPVLLALPERVETAMVENRLASVSVAIVLDGDIVFSQAFGFADIEEQKPATPKTIYPIGSITKVFTATVLAQLCEHGVVGLEDPAEKYLPEYRPRSPSAWARPTTLRQLAAHTSGLPGDAPVNFWCNFAAFSWLVTGGRAEMTWYVDCDSLLATLGDIELVHPPEIHAHYSNLNMQLLGLALERACGESLFTYMEREILAPLKMDDSGFSLDAEQRERLATGYVCTRRDAPMLKAPPYELGCAVYSGGLFSTAEDLARFLSFQFQDEPEESGGILETGSLRRMQTPQSVHLPGVHSAFGLGWGIVRIGDYGAIEHNGALLGYHAHVSAIPNLRVGIVAMSNSKHFMWRPDACKDLAREILVDLADAVRTAEQERLFDAGSVELAAYTGIYSLPGDVAHLEVSTTENGLTVTLTEIPEFAEQFEAIAYHTFCFAADAGRTPMLFFETAPDGRVSSVTFLSHRFRRQATNE